MCAWQCMGLSEIREASFFCLNFEVKIVRDPILTSKFG